jgi:hypothetical protein
VTAKGSRSRAAKKQAGHTRLQNVGVEAYCSPEEALSYQDDMFRKRRCQAAPYNTLWVEFSNLHGMNSSSAAQRFASAQRPMGSRKWAGSRFYRVPLPPLHELFSFYTGSALRADNSLFLRDNHGARTRVIHRISR